jgi:hypothetical protein
MLAKAGPKYIATSRGKHFPTKGTNLASAPYTLLCPTMQTIPDGTAGRLKNIDRLQLKTVDWTKSVLGFAPSSWRRMTEALNQELCLTATSGPW